MLFTSTSFGALIQGNGFTLWHYRTADSRATVTGAGYFAEVSGKLRPGDLMILQAADAIALVPIRVNAALGTGVTLDGVVGPLTTVRGAAQRFRFTQAAAAVVRTIMLAPLAAGLAVGSPIAVSAAVTGPISQVVFTLRDGSGTPLPPSITAPVTNGLASAVFAAPPQGTGYRFTAQDAGDPRVLATGRSFNVGADLKLMLAEDDGRLLLESGAGLKQ